MRPARGGQDSKWPNPDRVCFVAGAIGPTTKTSSISTDVNNPGARGTTFDELVAAYSEQVRGLLDGGVDLLLVETIFDTLNAKAAFFAIQQIFEERGISLPCRRDELPVPSPTAEIRRARSSPLRHRKRVPILASVTFIQAGSNRGVTGQTVEAYWNSISQRSPALGRHQLRAGAEGDAAVDRGAFRPRADLCQRVSECRLAQSAVADRFPETPETLAPQLQEWAQNGWLNIVGGCCGTTPAHIRAIAEAVKGLPPRVPPKVEPYLRLSGLEPLTIRPESNFVNIGERTNVTGSPKFAKLIQAGDYEGALAVARQQVENGAQMIDVNMDEGMLDGVAAMTRFLNLVASEPDIARCR